MNIKIIKKSYREVSNLPAEKPFKPKKPNVFFRTLLKLVSLPDLLATHFKCNKIDMDKLGKNEPCLYLMNHSSFIDLEIVANILYPKAFNIVATTDSFVGKGWLMRQIGCIPTKKFVSDLSLMRSMKHILKDMKSSVVMFPEAGYSLDGTATVLPESLGGCLKLLDVPVVMIRTYGAYTRDPLYNGLQRRKVKVSADMKYLLSPDDIKNMSAGELNELLNKEFTIDHFAWQQENKVRVSEPFRADFLNRTLYKCPHCNAEGEMEGKGTTLTCRACGASYELDEYGFLKSTNRESIFTHIPDWYAWQRDCVRKDILEKLYSFESPVRIFMSVDIKHIYEIGKGVLSHNENGFRLQGCDGELDYSQNPQATYSICSDFNWYEIGDVICIGNSKALYYCFPEKKGDFVAKVRIAAEEMYKLYKSSQKQRK
ncbi:MAG: 1-acyl-sn-glycerol-3-phosphate acyltransferase [Clostridia bacterium]|nr:1-acyl-sn-glycerol-3-phosphate acyltransferase [Clostridia bacterium]